MHPLRAHWHRQQQQQRARTLLGDFREMAMGFLKASTSEGETLPIPRGQTVLKAHGQSLVSLIMVPATLRLYTPQHLLVNSRIRSSMIA